MRTTTRHRQHGLQRVSTASASGRLGAVHRRSAAHRHHHQQPLSKAVLARSSRNGRGEGLWSHGDKEVLAAPPAWEQGGVLRRLASGALGALTAASLMLSAPMASVAEPQRVIKLPASANPEIFEAQRVMVEVWTVVGESFVDPDFNELDWPEELRKHMIAAYTSDAQPEKAWEEINLMLSRLGDPYTRRIAPDEYQTFKVSADGELQGIGLLLANDLTPTGHLRVLAPIKGGPADRAGILPGDEVVSINGEDTTGWSGDRAAHVLRGQGGTEVRVRLQRRTDGIPGVPSRPEPRHQEPGVIYKDVALRREAVAISPVYATLLTPPPSSTGGPSSSSAKPVGYVRLSQFSGNAGDLMRKAVSDLKAQGASRYILDLRSNPGGLVRAGVDVAAMWLDGEQTVFTVASRDPGTQVQTTESLGPALTDDPLVVLVDNMSASASEIVSGALHDNGRALVMGDSWTFGKGRIQSVFELQDGSALFVTVAKYQTPLGTDIDLRGIRPDLGCRPGDVAASLRRASGSAQPARNALGAPVLRHATQEHHHSGSSVPPDPIVGRATQAGALRVAAGLPMRGGAGQPTPSGFMPGVPVDASTESLLRAALAQDRCVLAAEEYLDTLGSSPSEKEAAARAKRSLTPAQQLYFAYINMHRPFGPR